MVNSGSASAGRWSWLTLPYLLERDGLELDKPAVVFEHTSRTYGELREAARRVAAAIVGLGVEELDRVAVLSTNRVELFEIEVGIAAGRGIMVPLNWRLREGEIANLLNRSQARAIFTEDRFAAMILDLRRAGRLPELRTVITLDGGAGDLAHDEVVRSSPPDRPRRVGRFEDPHEIIFTSGTTGAPKAVVWTHATVYWNSLQQIADFGLRAQDSTYAMIDLHYIGGRHAFTWPLLHQGGTVHVKRSGGFDAAEVLRYVSEHRISHVLWVPTMLYDILRLPDLAGYDTRALKMIMTGGMPVPASTTELVNAAFPDTDLIQVYGLTEGGAVLAFARPEDARRKPASAGRAALHVELRLADAHGFDVAPGVAGEIVVRAPTVAAGYWGDSGAEDTLARGGWLHTGDIARFDEEGFLHVVGRKRDLIISGGMNIFPSEVEDALREHPSVADAAVIGLPDEKWGEAVCAVVEPCPDAAVDADELIAFCSRRLASYKKPRSVRVVSELPRTTAGKPKKYLLRERFAGESVSVASAEATGG